MKNKSSKKNMMKILDHFGIDENDYDMHFKLKVKFVHYPNVYCKPWAYGSKNTIEELMERFDSVVFYSGYAYFLNDTDYAMYILENSC